MDVERDDRPEAVADNIGETGEWPATAASVSHLLARNESRDAWAEALARAINERRRAECMARIQSDADAAGASTCWSASPTSPASSASSSRRWSRNARATPAASGCSTTRRRPARPATCGWRTSQDRFFTRGAPDWRHDGAAEREHVGAPPRLRARLDRDRSSTPATTRACRSRSAHFNVTNGIDRVLVAPLVLPTRNLGWFALSSGRAPICEGAWHRALLDAMARQATLALHQSQLAEQQPLGSAAAGGARGAQSPRPRHPRHAGAGLRRHPDAAAGGAARRRLAAAGRRPQHRDRRRPRAHAHGRSPPLGLRAAAAAGRDRRRRRRARAHRRSRAPRHRRADRADHHASCRRSRAAPTARSSASRRKR